MKRENFYEVLQELVDERGLDRDSVMTKVEAAVRAAAKKNETKGLVKVDFDEEHKKITAHAYNYVVDEVSPTGPAYFFPGEIIATPDAGSVEVISSDRHHATVTVKGDSEEESKTYPLEACTRLKPLEGQMTLADAKALRATAREGSVLRTDVKLADFNRTAARVFLQTLMSGTKELQREDTLEYFTAKQGEIINAKVMEVKNGLITFDLGYRNKTEVMPMKEALPEEKFTPGDDKRVYIVKVEKTPRGPKVFLSRTNPEIVRRLFEDNIPEVKDGSIEIMGMARDAGSRTKVGVLSTKTGVDAKGACVGKGGERIRRINSELNNEKIDIFTWADNPVDLIAEALLPARVSSVLCDNKTKNATVVVKDDQYSLAIGTKGQNVTLAARAVGWHIDIRRWSDAITSGLEFQVNVKER